MMQMNKNTTEKSAKRKIISNPLLRSAMFIIPALLIAGIIILLATLLSKSFQADDEEESIQYLTFEVTGNKPEKITLPDESMVWLRPGSSIEYAENFEVNRLVKVYGEANFNVSKGKEKQFEVRANGLSVTVHGTIFSVISHKDDAKNSVVLVEGSVEVNLPDEKIMLKPSELITYNSETREREVSVVNVDDFLDWMRQDLHIEDTALHSALEAISEFYNHSLHIAANVPNTKITITVGVNDELQDILEVIEIFEPVISCRVEGTKLIVSRK